MQTVTLKIGFFKRKRQVPTDWTDLLNNPKLFRRIFPYIICGMKKTEIHAAILNDIMGIDISDTTLVHPFDMARLLEMMKDFDVENIPQIKQNMYQKIRIGWRRVYGAQDIFQQMETWEYALAENYYREYLETEDINFLDQFMAILYRPKARKRNKVGDIRRAFDDSLIEQQALAFASVPMPAKIATWMWFRQERERIAILHPYTFPTETKKGSDGSTWTDTILAMSSVGEEEKVAHTLLAIVLRRIENDNRKFSKDNQP